MPQYRTLLLTSAWFTFAACSGSTSAPSQGAGGTQGGSVVTGGSSPVSQGGSQPHATATTTAANGGTFAAGGVAQTGGVTFATGGASNVVGTTASSGSTVQGGATSLGGSNSAGGKQSIGGSSSTGGSNLVGGSSPLGGTSANGGAPLTGGSIGSGGTKATGGQYSSGGVISTGGSSASSTSPSIVETLDVANVWSGQPVFFALVTRSDQQFAAYYDDQRRMTVASRTLGSSTWTYKVLPSTLGWDSHNYVAMALDSSNRIHVSGNMHAVPLVYFRSSAVFDISTLAASTMVGANESSATYPVFFNGPTGDLVFEYRDGSSGNGNTIFNGYSVSTSTWTRTLNSALLDGTSSSMNAYPEGPVLGPDGYYHLVWVWRNTSDASTNHDLSYAKTQDLVHWFKANGTAITLPITPATGDIVDPVPVSGGMINNNTRVGFDAHGQPIIAYHKFDNGTSGNTQLYEARFENGAWVSHRATSWTYRWAFGGTGTLVFQIEITEGPKVLADGRLIQNFYHSQYGGQGTLVLDPTTLQAEQTLNPPLRPYPLALNTPESTYKDPVNSDAMVVRWQEDSGSGPDTGIKYLLRWETLPSNADQARTNAPPATKLRLYGFKQ